MTRPAQKNWFRRQGADEQPTASAGDVEGSDMSTKRIAAYASASSADTSSSPEGDAEHGVTADSKPLPHRSLGEEVDAILQTAQDSAAKLMEAATQEAERTRAEANAVATREFEQARHRAQTEREQAAKVRADAEEHAGRVRNEAETAAEKQRAEADNMATSLIEAARAKLAAADAEVEQKLRAAEESAGARVGALQAEARRHRELLQRLVAVLRDMSSQAEAFLQESEDDGDVEPDDQDRAVERADEDLSEALRTHGG